MPENPQPLFNNYYRNIGEIPIIKAQDVHHAQEGDNRNLAEELRYPVIHYVSTNMGHTIQNEAEIEDITSIYCHLQNFQSLVRVSAVTINGVNVPIDTTNADDSGFSTSPINGVNELNVVIDSAVRAAIVAGTEPNKYALNITLEHRDDPDTPITYSFAVLLEPVGHRDRNNIFVSDTHGNDNNDGFSWKNPKASLNSAITAASNIGTDTDPAHIVTYSRLSERNTLTIANTHVYAPNAVIHNSFDLTGIGSLLVESFRVFASSTLNVAHNCSLNMRYVERGIALVTLTLGTDTSVHGSTKIEIPGGEGSINIVINGTGYVYLNIDPAITVNFVDGDGNAVSNESRWYGYVNGVLRFGEGFPNSDNTLYLSKNGDATASGFSPTEARSTMANLDFDTAPYNAVRRIVALDNFTGVDGSTNTLLSTTGVREYDLRGVTLSRTLTLAPNQALIANDVNANINIGPGAHESTYIEVNEHDSANSLTFDANATGFVRIDIKKAAYSFSSITGIPSALSIGGFLNRELKVPTFQQGGTSLTLRNEQTNTIRIGSASAFRSVLIHMHFAYGNVLESGVISIGVNPSGILSTIASQMGLPTAYLRLSIQERNGIVDLVIAGGTAGNLFVRYNIFSAV